MDVPLDHLQDVYLKFTCELYILNLLKHPRIVELRGSISNVTEYTLLLEVYNAYEILFSFNQFRLILYYFIQPNLMFSSGGLQTNYTFCRRCVGNLT